MKKKNLSIKRSVLVSVAVWLALIIGAPPALADNAVKLRILLLTIGDETVDPGFAYIKPVLDEMGVPYDVINAGAQDLTPAMLASSSTGTACKAVDAGCVGNYNGIILTDSDLDPAFTPAEWDMLHDYQKNFGVRQAVLSGWPGTYWDPNPPYGIHLDYGLVYSSSGNNYEGTWTVPDPYKKEVFEYVNTANPLQVTDFAFAANPRNDGTAMRDGTVASVVPLVKTQNGEALVSIVQYAMPNQAPVREVMISTITNASFLIHSKVLAYEFINWVTQGVFVGKRYVHMTAHVDDLFLANDIWDPATNSDHPTNIYRLSSTDISNAVSQQAAFRAAHPLAGNFKLDFAFNGAGAVIDPTAATLTANMSEDLVAAVVANKDHFRFISHTFTHADMDKPPTPANAPCVYDTFTAVSPIEAEITRNRTVWGLLGLPEQNENNQALVTGNHSGLKDRKCTDDQADDVHFDEGGANSLFLQAAANTGVDYLASDSSQRAQNIEQYITHYDASNTTDRLMLPRWPTNVFYNVTNPTELTSEYNYIFYQRFIDAGQDPCQVPGAICAPRDYAQILLAEADTAFRHMLTFNKWPHFFHQSNVAKYDGSGSTLQFDWLKAVFTEYGRLFKLPVRNYPYYQIGSDTKESISKRSADVHAVWNRATSQVILSADKAVSNLPVTGVSGGELYGGQYIRHINITLNPAVYPVDRGLAQ